MQDGILLRFTSFFILLFFELITECCNIGLVKFLKISKVKFYDDHAHMMA